VENYGLGLAACTLLRRRSLNPSAREIPYARQWIQGSFEQMPKASSARTDLPLEVQALAGRLGVSVSARELGWSA
jgi:hypothetical protein